MNVKRTPSPIQFGLNATRASPYGEKRICFSTGLNVVDSAAPDSVGINQLPWNPRVKSILVRVP